MDRIELLLKRPQAYFNIEGIGELGIGFMLLSTALLEWLQTHSGQGSVWNQIYTTPVFVGVVCAIIHYGSKAVKERLTFPRTGYVEYRKDRGYWIKLAGVFVFAAAGAAVLATAIKRHWTLSAPDLLLGIVFAASYAYGFARAVRWKWMVAGLEIAGSVSIALLPAELPSRLAKDSFLARQISPRLMGTAFLSFVLYGGLLLISGGISLWLYLHHTHAPTAPESA